MNTVRHAVCPAGTPAARHAGACWVQNQNQNQNQTVLTAVSGSSVAKTQFQVTVTYGDWTWS